ncbi:hypothetical protein TL16_g09549 [Triparma laevis f. inornata]|uniref:Exosome RNA helicase MTR4-like beta-barrel domain-containing protein n=1 Tax=Triparma laevis f. inornata TaxID=1714386 RepID=A0A9W7B8A6_9STRA|nr:hypothetical protein TL16_g09549 [Triparma laevis f. inornata]
MPMLDPINDMKIKSSEFEKSLEKVEKLTKELQQHAISKLASEERSIRLEAYETKSTLLESGRLMRKQSKVRIKTTSIVVFAISTTTSMASGSEDRSDGFCADFSSLLARAFLRENKNYIGA